MCSTHGFTRAGDTHQGTPPNRWIDVLQALDDRVAMSLDRLAVDLLDLAERVEGDVTAHYAGTTEEKSKVNS